MEYPNNMVKIQSFSNSSFIQTFQPRYINCLSTRSRCKRVDQRLQIKRTHFNYKRQILFDGSKGCKYYSFSYTWKNTNRKNLIRINNNNIKIVLYFDSQAFEVNQEEIILTDKRLSAVWGQSIFRLVFKAKEKSRQGQYIFKIKYQ